MTGRLYGVGLGPGDPELMTVKAARLIGEADVIAYHSARHGRSIARSVAEPYLREGQLEERLVYPVTTETTDHPGGYEGAIADFYELSAKSSPNTSTPGVTWCCCAKVTRSSTAPTCTCTSGWPDGSRPRWFPA